ncbi:hypothetical protein LDC_1890, partial [sediment metagenome]
MRALNSPRRRPNPVRDAYRLEPLEPRVLLSADPVLGAAQALLIPAADHDQALLGAYDFDHPDALLGPTLPPDSGGVAPSLMFSLEHDAAAVPAETKSQVFAVDATAFDVSQVGSRSGFLDGT